MREFEGDPRLGVLQIRSARKEAIPVTDQELHEFAREKQLDGRRLAPVDFGELSGVSRKYREKDLAWTHWWLRSGDLVVYVTYNVTEQYEGVEDEAVLKILASLASIDQT